LTKDVIYLRHKDGESIGPMPMRALEVLFDARVVDEATPVSQNGVMFRALRDFPLLLDRVQEVKKALVEGQDPWAEEEAASTDDMGQGSGLDPQRPLPAMLRVANEKKTGVLALRSADGELRLAYKEGKVVKVDTTIDRLSLGISLMSQGVCDASALTKAEERAPQMGGDLGGALISLGLVQPHVYLEKFVTWAKRTLAAVLTEEFEDASFEQSDVANPAVPLGFDRLGVLIEIVRDGLDRSWLNERLSLKKACPLIPSHVEGVNIEELKLKATELRVMNAINGAKTFGEVLDSLGGTEQKSLEVMRVIFFAEQTGFCVFGQDPLLAKEVQEAARMKEQLRTLQKKNYFELLGVSEKSSDEDTRGRYTELAKQYHPDKLRPGAAQELIDARKEVFALITEAFEAMGTEQKRYEYANALATGTAGGTDDLEKVQAVLHAETQFKKAEILAKVKKWDEALQLIDEAIALKSDDIEFKIYHAYYHSRLAVKKGDIDAAERAIREIQMLLKKDSNIASGYMFLGHLHKEVNKPDTAAKYFEKVLEFDPKNADAAREVRLHNMRADKGKKKGKWF
jgi:curved DNA-binding protein CbpA